MGKVRVTWLNIVRASTFLEVVLPSQECSTLIEGRHEVKGKVIDQNPKHSFCVFRQAPENKRRNVARFT